MFIACSTRLTNVLQAPAGAVAVDVTMQTCRLGARCFWHNLAPGSRTRGHWYVRPVPHSPPADVFQWFSGRLMLNVGNSLSQRHRLAVVPRAACRTHARALSCERQGNNVFGLRVRRSTATAPLWRASLPRGVACAWGFASARFTVRVHISCPLRVLTKILAA